MLQYLLGAAWHLISRALLVDVAILGVVALIWLVSGAWSATAVSTGLFWGGAASALIGIGIVSGGSEARGAAGYHHARSAGPTDLHDRTDQEATYMHRGYGWMYIFVLAGAVAIGLSFAVPAIL